MDPTQGSSTVRKKRILKVKGVSAKMILRKKSVRNVKNKKSLVKQQVPSKQKKKKKGVKCGYCKKNFATASAKNAHVESKHKGRRFICTLCHEDFHSKFAFDRHITRKHPGKQDEVNDGENAYYIQGKIEMTSAAKDALIKRLQIENDAKDRIIEGYKLKVQELENLVDKVNNICATLGIQSTTSPPPTAVSAPSKKLFPDLAFNVFENWLRGYLDAGNLICEELTQGIEILNLTHQSLSEILKFFIENIRKPNNEPYAPDTVYNLMLAIQKYLYDNDRNGNILLDPAYINVAESLNKLLENFHSRFERSSK